MRRLAALGTHSRIPGAVVLADDGVRAPDELSIFHQPFAILTHVWHPHTANTKPAIITRAVALLDTEIVLFADGSGARRAITWATPCFRARRAMSCSWLKT